MSNQDTTEPFVLNDEDMDKWIKYKDKITNFFILILPYFKTKKVF